MYELTAAGGSDENARLKAAPAEVSQPDVPQSESIHYAQVHPHATEKDIAGLFAKHGSVLRVSKSVTPSEQGPHAVGQIVMATETEAQVAVEALHRKFTYPGMLQPMLAVLASQLSGVESEPRGSPGEAAAASRHSLDSQPQGSQSLHARGPYGSEQGDLSVTPDAVAPIEPIAPRLHAQRAPGPEAGAGPAPGAGDVPSIAQLQGFLGTQPHSQMPLRTAQPPPPPGQPSYLADARMRGAPMPMQAPPHFAAPRMPRHLRDGVPASPQEVVQAISEYMARPSSAKPPAGCAPDAVKLFVGNIPKHCTEAVLHKVFQNYGLVVEIAVTRNRHSAESKGSAFVWYSTCMEAARAILALHSRYAFPDAKGEHVRLVTVRPAVKGNRPMVAPMLPPSHAHSLGHFGGLEQPGFMPAAPPGADMYGAEAHRMPPHLGMAMPGMGMHYDDAAAAARAFDPLFAGYGGEPQQGYAMAMPYGKAPAGAMHAGAGMGPMEYGLAYDPASAAAEAQMGKMLAQPAPGAAPGPMSLSESLAKLQLQLTAMQPAGASPTGSEGASGQQQQQQQEPARSSALWS